MTCATPAAPGATDDGTKDWFSVREAAEYLGVSQPTIFRWMKEGILSFYKVGGSTRFGREGLDAVIEKQTGSKEAEASRGRCASCGHSVLVEGSMQGLGRLYFRPEKTKFWTFQEALVPIRCAVCAACGHIHLHADTDKLTSLMPAPEDDPDAGASGEE